MLKMIRKFLSTMSLLAIALSVPGLSQTGRQEQKGQQGQQGQPQAKKSKAVNESCDGALNIAPTKSMTFVRKRRPVQNDSKNNTKSESKKEPAPAPESKERQPGNGDR
jgi:hypothetical protein